MGRKAWLLLFGATVVACAARTEIGDMDADTELDSSLPDVEEPDVSLPDVSPPPDDVIVIDVTPPPPPPFDAEPPPFDAQPPPFDAEPPPFDAEPPPDDGGTTCPDTCTHNHECQKQCTPHLTTGRYCCDQETETCYAWTGNHCPPQIIDAGFD